MAKCLKLLANLLFDFLKDFRNAADTDFKQPRLNL